LFGPAWHEAYAAASGLYQNLCFCKKVVITAVGGYCAGAGSLLVLCSDLTVAADDALFASPFQALPESNLVLAALTMRLNRAKSWMLGGVALNARQAWDAGLINRIAAPGTLDDAAQKMARAVTRMPLDGIAMSKINVETSLDAQGVGREFDMAGFYAASLQRAWDDTGDGAAR
jgi:enoyl-CoA hydratase/carnithine racemase